MTVKFGAVPNQSAVTWHDLLAIWEDLDRDSAFDHLWLMDHFVTGFGTAFDGSGGASVAASMSLAWPSLPWVTMPLISPLTSPALPDSL